MSQARAAGGDIFFGLGKEKKRRQSSQCIICHVLMTCMENKRRCRRSSLIAALFHDGLIRMNLWHFRRPQNSPTDFWASASSLCFDWNQHLLVLVLFLLDCLTVQDCESLLGRRGCFSWVHFTLKEHLKVSKHTPPFNSLFFFHPRLLSGIALHNWLSRNILQVQNKNPAHAAIFSQFPDKTDASFDIYNWKETKKTNQQVSLDGAKNLWGAGWEVKMGYLCPLWHHTGLLGQTSVLF